MILLTTILFNSLVCNGFQWKQSVPVELKDITYIHDEEQAIRKMYESEDDVKYDEPNKKQYNLHSVTGSNCGSPKLPIIVNRLELPEVIVLGDNATVTLDVTIAQEIKDVSVISVVAQKEGLPIDIPCTDNIGTCNYTNPCEMLKKIPCPPEVIKRGWNCRCPLEAKEFVLPKTVVAVPKVPLPAFLVDGKYNIKVQMFNGASELLCYKVQVTLKEK